MSNLLKKHWYSDGKLLIGKLDRWASRRNRPARGEREPEWLGWDAWVLTDDSTRTTHDSSYVA